MFRSLLSVQLFLCCYSLYLTGSFSFSAAVSSATDNFDTLNLAWAHRSNEDMHQPTVIFRKQPSNSYSRKEILKSFHYESPPHILAVAVALASQLFRGPHPTTKILTAPTPPSPTTSKQHNHYNSHALHQPIKYPRTDGRAGYGARLRLLLTYIPGHESGVGSSPTLFSIRLAIVRYPRYSFLVIFFG
ncbi:hypothetical protein BKA58DRAFT_52236 [Alternaria rosae]|uniref:uncharacterized protein n=1 Tax=Alternaria rosae TaxID=1187941 RepID=UPI001E8D96EC|nr:uncharacterized protein BKA58DRAFT_52236 [Alternaria rosae]KAH6859028.1 hypothetical protein BKA58DRAFT_52236 [Alternaria rosae]